MTVAPMSANSIEQYGPAKTREKSATIMPSSGLREFDINSCEESELV
jgi:hypothetical protein